MDFPKHNKIVRQPLTPLSSFLNAITKEAERVKVERQAFFGEECIQLSIPGTDDESEVSVEAYINSRVCLIATEDDEVAKRILTVALHGRCFIALVDIDDNTPLEMTRNDYVDTYGYKINTRVEAEICHEIWEIMRAMYSSGIQ